MRLFLSYASQDRAVADSIREALAAQGHQVFFDRDSLPPGASFDDRIHDAIYRCDLFIALLSPDAVDAGSYTLNEIGMAAQLWPNASFRVLPVMLKPTSFDALPPYLKSVTVLQTDGNLAAAVVDAVHGLAALRRRRVLLKASVVIGTVAVVAIAAVLAWRHFGSSPLTGSDGAPAVLVPAGKSVLGDDENTPLREIYTNAFYIDKVEVTVARYARFLKATSSLQPPDYWDEVDAAKDADKPVIGVSWRDADSYCKWAGRRLPTAAEWERAARGADQRMYPWGNEPPDAARANSGRDEADKPYADGVAVVGAHPTGASPFGVQDLAGNVGEFVADWYSESFPHEDVRNPRGPAAGTDKVIKGGSWYDAPARLVVARDAYAGLDYRSDDTGFRCARDGG
ncbi:MAG: SUMF1/EgtB/PvdO family nonheme iron enzyme [Pseudomonadota bacterium]